MAVTTPTISVSANTANRRVVILVGADIGNTVTVYRRAGANGDDTPVRGGKDLSMTTQEKILLDYEVPQGSELTYYAVATDGIDSATSTEETVPAFDFGGDIIFPLGDPKAGMKVHIESLKQLKYDISRDVVRVWGRPDPVVVSGVREMPSGTLNLITLELDERKQLLDILRGGSVMGLNPWKEEYGLTSIAYFSVGSLTETRPSPLASEPARRWSLEVQQVAAPAAAWKYPTGDAESWEQFRDTAPLWSDVQNDIWLDAVGL